MRSLRSSDRLEALGVASLVHVRDSLNLYTQNRNIFFQVPGVVVRFLCP